VLKNNPESITAMTFPFYAIGYSTRTIDEFVTLLQTADVERVIIFLSLGKILSFCGCYENTMIKLMDETD